MVRVAPCVSDAKIHSRLDEGDACRDLVVVGFSRQRLLIVVYFLYFRILCVRPTARLLVIGQTRVAKVPILTKSQKDHCPKQEIETI